MSFGDTLFLALYCVTLTLLSIFGLHRFYTTYLYYKTKGADSEPESEFDQLPLITVQLPVFNEMYVVERLINAVTAMEYPKALMEVQVLDDSTDDTTEIAKRVVEAKRAEGYDITHIRRKGRLGFKAGALELGLKVAKGEFVAIFDADFVPTPDFLVKTIHHFTDSKVGMVQARWDHMNRSYSALTEVEALFLDGHFIFEHGARSASGRFFNFNGTAGVWRKSCIQDAGGWQHDTLTEDLDLSYRAQIKGWKFKFLPDLLAPAELPVEMNSFKSQQHRWAKGSIQTAGKILPALLKSDQPFKVKVEACFHLMSNFAYLLMLLLSLLMPASIFIRSVRDWKLAAMLDLPVFALATASVGCFYILTYKEATGKWLKGILYLPVLLSVGIGLCVNNSRAVMEALLGKVTGFERTPKYNVLKPGDSSWVEKKYRGVNNKFTLIELALGIYFTGALYMALDRGLYSPIPFLLLFQVGFLYVSFQSLFQGAFLKLVRAGKKG